VRRTVSSARVISGRAEIAFARERTEYGLVSMAARSRAAGLAGEVTVGSVTVFIVL
jgi:hypothetical protein